MLQCGAVRCSVVQYAKKECIVQFVVLALAIGSGSPLWCLLHNHDSPTKVDCRMQIMVKRMQRVAA